MLKKKFGRFGPDIMKGNAEIMEAPETIPPAKEILVSILSGILDEKGLTKLPVTVVDRQPNIYNSTFPSEIVTCRLADGNELKLFCKYGRATNDSHDHKGNVAYEASVYRHVLEALKISTPKFFGSAEGETNDTTWLVIEFMQGAARLELWDDPSAVVDAARWIGRFHALNEARTIAVPGFKNYRADYFHGWVKRTLQHADEAGENFPWLAKLCKRYEEMIPGLIAKAATVIHGEFYPNNILVREGNIYPVDWESSAKSFGEIDLATLTDGWGDSIDWTPETHRQCVLAYQRERWPVGPPADFERTFLLARLYVQFRWLGDSNEWTRKKNQMNWRFQELRLLGEQLGIL
jgi:aminoglycoside phosphotransferase (APT) family kinase protein